MTRTIASLSPEVGATNETSRKADLTDVFATEPAFRAWYDVAAPRVYAYLHGRCGGDAALAEELTQQTFISAIRSRHGFSGRADVMTWLLTIARSRLVDHYRRRSREERRHLRIVVSEMGRPEHAEETLWRDRDTRDDILAALRALPSEQRAALVLHHVDGLSVREVARHLDRSESAVESLLARARRRFRELYGGIDHVG